MTSLVDISVAVIGWIGSLALVAAYFLVARGVWAGDSLKYNALNMSGAILLIINCAYVNAWPSAVANLFFLAVGVYTVITVKRAYMKQLAKRQAAKLRRRNSELDLAGSRLKSVQNTADACPAKILAGQFFMVGQIGLETYTDLKLAPPGQLLHLLTLKPGAQTS